MQVPVMRTNIKFVLCMNAVRSVCAATRPADPRPFPPLQWIAAATRPSDLEPRVTTRATAGATGAVSARAGLADRLAQNGVCAGTAPTPKGGEHSLPAVRG